MRYFDEDRLDPMVALEKVKEKRNDLISYLAHCNKPEHLKTAMEMIDGIARLESNVATMVDERRKSPVDCPQETTAPERKLNVMELPVGTRKVSIEL